MSSRTTPLAFSEIEIRSYLPSGWGLQTGSTGRWEDSVSRWSVEIQDGADNEWTLSVEGDSAARVGRLEALRASIDRLQRKSLGRKSVLTG